MCTCLAKGFCLEKSPPLLRQLVLLLVPWCILPFEKKVVPQDRSNAGQLAHRMSETRGMQNNCLGMGVGTRMQRRQRMLGANSKVETMNPNS